MTLLNETSYAQTFGAKMLPVYSSEPPFDFWNYVDLIPKPDFGGYDFIDTEVSCVYRSNDECYEHVLLKTQDNQNIVMAVILDLKSKVVFGHYLLNLEDIDIRWNTLFQECSFPS